MQSITEEDVHLYVNVELKPQYMAHFQGCPLLKCKAMNLALYNDAAMKCIQIWLKYSMCADPI